MAAIMTIGASTTADAGTKAMVTMGLCMAIDIMENGNPMTGDIRMSAGAINAVTADEDTKHVNSQHACTGL